MDDSPQTINNDDILNNTISIDEISKACLNSKNSESPGIDQLPYEVHKNNRSIKLLHALLNRCLSTGINRYRKIVPMTPMFLLSIEALVF